MYLLEKKKVTHSRGRGARLLPRKKRAGKRNKDSVLNSKSARAIIRVKKKKTTWRWCGVGKVIKPRLTERKLK